MINKRFDAMEPKLFIGLDVSKLTMDIAILQSGKLVASFKIPNTEEGVKGFVTVLKTTFKSKSTDTVCCAESIGIYTLHLENVLYKDKIPLCLESALRIKRSMGIQRGKNDAVDAFRIAQYASRFYSSLKIWEPPRACLKQLKILSAIRKKLLKIKVMLDSDGKLEAYYLPKTEKEVISGYYNKSLEAVKCDIESIENIMEEVIQSDARLVHLMKLQTSIPGIGKVIATQMIIATNEFTNFLSAKKFAAFCGVAPFERQSGTSLLSKSKVSHLANKELKSLLHLASLQFIKRPKYFLGRYYLRKAQEGKNKMSILNAMKNKLLHQIFSCVNNDKMYTDP